MAARNGLVCLPTNGKEGGSLCMALDFYCLVVGDAPDCSIQGGSPMCVHWV